MGVFATATVPEGATFGPVPSAITLTDPAVLIGHMTCDVRPNIHTVKVDIQEYTHGTRLSEWTPYVQAARDNNEQTLEAHIKDGQLYYRTTRTVCAGDELLVWYSEEYARILAIPELQGCHLKDGMYSCSNCSQSFRYPHTLRAHMRFKCERRHAAMSFRPPGGVVVRPGTSFPGLDFKSQLPDNAPFVYPHLYGLGRDSHGCPPPTANSQSSPASSVDSARSTESPVRPTAHMGREVTRSPEKRKLDSAPDWVRDVKRRSMDDNSPPHSSHSPDDISEAGKVDMNRNLRHSMDDDDTGGSAFRKVEKHNAPFQRLMAPPVASLDGPYDMSAGRPLPASLAQDLMTKSGVSLQDKNSLASLAAAYNRHPLGMVGPVNLGAYIPNWNIASAVTDVNRNPMKIDALKVGEKFSDIQNIENSNPHFKMGAEFGGNGRVSNILPYYRSQNPMVEKLIQSALHVGTSSVSSMSLAALSVSQNWCAKCNASFRMTSDLVYHMRSHHSPEFDHSKKKREEKLKCNVCGETFRERHHLTRHMTSHQDM